MTYYRLKKKIKKIVTSTTKLIKKHFKVYKNFFYYSYSIDLSRSYKKYKKLRL